MSAQNRPAPPKTPRIYIFDGGSIKGLDPKLFNFTKEELKEQDFVVTSYLIVHPRGTLMFDSGTIPDSAFPADGSPVTQGIMSATKALKPQMAAAGYKPSDVTYFALSHFHSDHTANANDFAGATWIVQKAERDAMFADKPQGIIQPAQFSALKNAKTKLLNDEDFDVFGDGTVVVKSAPGHTPGHQVLFVKLAKTGPVRAGRRSVPLPGGTHDRARSDVRVQRRSVEGGASQDRSVPEANRRATVDRARQGDSRGLPKAPQFVE